MYRKQIITGVKTYPMKAYLKKIFTNPLNEIEYLCKMF